MMAIGMQIKLMEKEPISMRTGLAIVETGSKINSMARVQRPGLMVLGMKECTGMARKMEKAL